MMIQKLLAGVLVMSILGCAGAKKETRKEAPPAKSTVSGLGKLDESFDPSELKEPPYPIKPKPRAGKTGKTVKAAAAASEDTVQAEQIGYRVQLLQTEDAREARELQKRAIIDLDEDVYIQFDDPYYKVRAGDFASRYDAEAFLEKAVKRGFSSAWIVRTRIQTQKDTTPPVPDAGKQQPRR